MKDKGVTATAVCPGWMKTGLFDRGVIGAKKATKNFSGMVTPDVVAKKAVSDADKGKDVRLWFICKDVSSDGKGASAKSHDESMVDATKIIVPKTTSSLRSFLYLISGKMQRSRKYFQKLRCWLKKNASHF